MTDLESPKKNNDCYFYYYSTCSKGDSCGFRHEPSALGCEITCSFWKEGKCLNIHCNFRHMELRKNRKVIPCYWEAQPGGCLKPHCPFMHQNERPMDLDDGKLNQSESSIPENCTQAGNFKNTSSVDSLVVSFEEESDSESTPSKAPEKTAKIKTLEEIKLEKIAAASAAYYSYTDEGMDEHEKAPENDLRHRILKRFRSKNVAVKTGKRKLTSSELARILGDSSISKEDLLLSHSPYKRLKIDDTESVPDIKIKTLDEIRAERINRQDTSTCMRILPPEQLELTPESKIDEIEEAEVSSTSNDEPGLATDYQKPTSPQITLKPLRRLNLQKIRARSSKFEENFSGQEDTKIDTTEDVQSTSRIESKLDSVSPKDFDESMLLLDEAEEDIHITSKCEEDLLSEIDTFLDN